MTKVFVYGTLKKGHGNHRLLQNATYLGQCTTDDDLFYMSSYGGFPAVCRITYEWEECGYISGELYDVDADTLQALDWLEGHPDFYQRELVSVDGDEVCMYLINEAVMPNSSQGVSIENQTYTWR